ncbi:recombinase family protein [Rhizobium leguminosarum]|uniref:recombinase family protein n=1 Tax=Rhizobium leguminosarum TaxID=384 RepID=UPI00247656A8|nr:recombinase family protein [Rhizobium leguminosarum]
MRVSTGRQVENDLSIPDQRRQATEFCKARGWHVAIEFVDAGLSGTDEKRPELQRLLDLTTGGDSPLRWPSADRAIPVFSDSAPRPPCLPAARLPPHPP